MRNCVISAFMSALAVLLLAGCGEPTAEGLKNREIAKLLSLSEHTVKNHLFRIFERLGISSRTELILYVLGQRGTAEQEEPDPLSV